MGRVFIREIAGRNQAYNLSLLHLQLQYAGPLACHCLSHT